MSHADSHASGSSSPACKTFSEAVGPYLEGENLPGVTTHASVCVRCGTLLDELREVITASAQLDDVEPPPRLWANLRVALQSEGLISHRAGFLQRWADALAALRRPVPATALACLGILSLSLVSGSNLPVSRPDISQLGQASVSLPSIDKNLQHTVQELQANYQARQISFRPQVKAAYQRSLQSLDASIEECRDSVERQPGDTLAHEYLLTAYQQKAEVLQSALESEDQGR